VSPLSSAASSHHTTNHSNNVENNRTTPHSPIGSSSPELSPGNYHRVRHHSGSLSPSISPTSSPTPTGVLVQSPSVSCAPTLVRPSALAPSAAGLVGSAGFTPTSAAAGDSGLKGLYLPEPLVHPHHHHSHHPHHPHHHQLALAAAAAQHFQAAGLAAALAQQTAAAGHHGGGFLPGAAGATPGAGAPGHLPPHHPTPHPAAMARDTYPLYPWLLSRHGRIFPHRFPAGTSTHMAKRVYGNACVMIFCTGKYSRTGFPHVHKREYGNACAQGRHVAPIGATDTRHVTYFRPRQLQ
jgi:homeobox protein EMX